ncbi:hypothetical protein SUDANB176_00783 [Streptomyces sp. enrichment culture]
MRGALGVEFLNDGGDQPVRNQDTLLRGARERVQDVGRPVQGDHRLAGAGPALHHGHPAVGGADDLVLLGLQRRDGRVHPARTPCRQSLGQRAVPHDVLVGQGRGGAASDREGARWPARLLGERYRVHEVPISERVIHPDDGLTAVREGLAVVCREQYVDGVPAQIADWDLIDAGLQDAVDLLAGNSPVLGPGEVLVDERLTGLAEALTARDVTVHTPPFDAVAAFAGGFRCAHHPLVRELDG